MQVRSETARVLITVKASPQPSAKYGDTVCVAGIRLDGGLAEWVRLYPVPFRWMSGEHQFKKYDIVTAEIRRATDDQRPESFKPDIDSIEVVDHLKDWKARQPIFENVPRTTTCALRAGVAERLDAPSLGMVRVASLDGIEFEAHPGWTPAEQAKIAASVVQQPLSLFGDATATPVPLRAPRFRVRYRYHCEETGCLGHGGTILDWEMTALQRNVRGSDEEIKAAVRKKFVDEKFGSGKHASLFMGNIADPTKRLSFSVLGVHSPSTGVASSVSLFDLDADE